MRTRRRATRGRRALLIFRAEIVEQNMISEIKDRCVKGDEDYEYVRNDLSLKTEEFYNLLAIATEQYEAEIAQQQQS